MDDNVDVDDLFDQVESQSALVSEGILKFLETPGTEGAGEDSSTGLTQESALLKEIEAALDSLTKLFRSNKDVRSGKEIAERLSDMEDFLRLMLRLMQEMMIKLLTSEIIEMPLKVLDHCHTCYVAWTDRSTLFSEKLLRSCEGFLHHLTIQLRAVLSMWVPTESFVTLSTSALSILGNMAQEEKCHKALVQNKIPEVVLPFCFNSSIQIRWESKSLLAVLLQLAGSWYHPFLKLSVDEINLLRLCFKNAAISDDQHVIVKLGESYVRYSAFELALGISGLCHHKFNRAAFADPEILAASFNMLVAGSLREKVVSIRLISRLVDEPSTRSVILSNHPDMLQVLLSLTEDDKCGDSLKQEASKLIEMLLDVELQDSQKLESFVVTVDSQTPNKWKEELERLLAWATTEMNKSKVLHNAADSDTVEIIMSMMFLVSHLSVMLRFKEGCIDAKSGLQKYPGFLLVLQDYVQRHFLKAIKMSNCIQPLHPICVALHCTLILSTCNSQFRHELGVTGVLWQLVKHLRSLQMIPGWDKQLFRIAELMLMITANCSLEWDCQRLLAEKNIVNILLLFCKSDYFGIRLGAKSTLSSVSCFVAEENRRFLKLDEHEQTALLHSLKQLAESGDYKKQFVTSTCKYYFSSLDLLLLLNALASNPLNAEIIVCGNMCSVVPQLFASGTEMVKDSIIELLWRLCRIQDIRLEVLKKLPEIDERFPEEVFGTSKPSLFSPTAPSVLKDTTSLEHHSAYEQDQINIKAELSEWLDLLFETMDEIWRSRVPAALEGGSYLLDPLKILNMFAHLAKFFEAADKALQEEACHVIIRMPTFLYLVANVMEKQIEAKASKEDSKEDVSSIIVIFHCLQTWINCCEEMKDHLGHSGIINTTVLLHLQLIHAFPALDEEYVQIAEGVLSTLCQCMTRESCRNYLLNLDCEDLLVSMSKSSIFEIGSNAKMILSSLSHYLPHKYRSSFKLTSEEMTDMLHSLNIVLEQGVPEGELFFSAVEILKNFSFFIQFEPNRKVMAFSPVYKPIAHLLQNGDSEEKGVACKLLWKLVTKPVSEDTIVIKTKKTEEVEELQPSEYLAESDIQSFLIQQFPEILAILASIAQNESTQIPMFFCTHLVLTRETAEVIGKDISKTLTFAEGCYLCDKYAECIKLVSWVHQATGDEEIRRKALDLKGKALYYVFVAEKRLLKKGTSQASDALCYNKAREAINLLGLTIDSGVDKVAEKLLDRVHINYLRKTRSRDLVRCLLCQKKGIIRASHVWPNSVLKHLLKCMTTSEHRVFSVPWKGYGSLQSSKQITFPMLCDSCEQLLSRSCESKFKVEFFTKLYQPEDVYAKLAKPQSIEYGAYLYHFCLSIIFRALPLVDSDIYQIGNADDIYNLFTTCRELILRKNISDSPNKPSIALIISPTLPPEGVRSVPMIDRILHSPGMILLGPWSVESDAFSATSCHGKASFLLVSLGILNLIVSLDSKTPLLLPPACMISPSGGTLVFPEDSKRFFAMPLGVWKLLESAAASYSKQVFHMPQKLVKSQEWAKREFSDLQSMLLGFKVDESASKSVVSYLPANFRISDVGKTLKLPAGHSILLHTYENNESWEAYIFLAIGSDECDDSHFSSFDPYVVLLLHVPGYAVCIGYFVSRTEAMTTSSLVSSEDKPMLPTVESKYKTKAITDSLLPKLLKQRGFSSMDALFFWLKRGQTLQLDVKCIEPCTYCSGKCDNCMETTSFDRGPKLGYHAVHHAVRFCDEECLKHYCFHRSSSPIQFLFHSKQLTSRRYASSDKHFLSVFCGLLDTNLERNKVIAKFYCEDSQTKRVYVLLQVRFVPKQRFVAFYLSDDFLPVSCLPESLPLTDDDMFIITGLQLVMKEILTKLNLSYISTCVSSVSGPITFQEPMELPPVQIFLNSLPAGFDISEDESVACPHPYSIVLHRTKNIYVYVLAELKAGSVEDSELVVLFYFHSVDCTVRTAYLVKDSLDSIIVKNAKSFQSHPPLSTYDELIVECCKQMVVAETMCMLRESEVNGLQDFINKFKSGNSKSTLKCPKSCWLCHPK